MVRGEKGRVLAAAAIGLVLVLIVLTARDLSSIGPSNQTAAEALQSAKVVDLNWYADPEFAGRGTVKWSVSVENITEKPIRDARVEFTSYDANGKMLATTFTYVHAIPPHGRRSEELYADYFGNEKSATIVLTQVNFEE